MNTMQYEFDQVVAHLYKQGRPATANGNCLYRAEVDGQTLSCAVGCRIPDDVYVPDMDVATGDCGTGVSGILLRFGDVLPPEIKAYHTMFEHIQSAHDYFSGEASFADWEGSTERLDSRLKKIAEIHGLTFTKPEVSNHG
jgi:hypothetical protein